MAVTKYSVIMGIAWFTTALLAGCLLIKKGKKVRYEIILLIFLLGFIRLLFPLEFWPVKEIRDWYVYPFFQRIWSMEPIHGFFIATIFLWIWGIGSVSCFIMFLCKLRQLHGIIRRAESVSQKDKLYRICGEAAGQLGYTRQFRVAVTTEFSTAVSAGLLTPVILIPVKVQNFTEKELLCIFRHELMHYLKKDLGVQWGMNLLQCIFWWNPVMYFVKSSVEQIIELRCDARVCRDMGDEERIIYLQGITRVLKTSQKEPELGIGYAKKKSNKFLRRRFCEVLEPVKKQSCGLTALLAGSCIAVFVFSYTFIIQPASIPDAFEVEGCYLGTEDKDVQNFLLKLPDGTYIYNENLKEKRILTEDEITQSPYCELSIYEYTEGE